MMMAHSLHTEECPPMWYFNLLETEVKSNLPFKFKLIKDNIEQDM